MFSNEEIVKILEDIGYELIETPEDVSSSRKSRFFTARSKNYLVAIDGEMHDPETIFKKEIIERIFKIKN